MMLLVPAALSVLFAMGLIVAVWIDDRRARAVVRTADDGARSASARRIALKAALDASAPRLPGEAAPAKQRPTLELPLPAGFDSINTTIRAGTFN